MSEPDSMPPGGVERWHIARVGWFILVPVAAAFFEQQALAVLAKPACLHRSSMALHLVALAALLLVSSAFWLARAEWRESADRGSERGRSRFKAWVGFASCAIGGALVIAQWMPVVFLDPCQR